MIAVDPAFEAATYRKVSRRLIPLLFVAYIAAYVDRVNVGFAKLGMGPDLRFSETVYGIGAGIFFIGYFVFEVPSNVLLQRVGARIWIARIMIGWGILSALTMLVRTPGQFYGMRFALGVAEAGFFPGIILYLTYWFPRAHRARMTAAFMTAVAVAGIVGGPISGWILGSLDGRAGLAGWQWLFLIEGVPSVLIGIVVLMWLTDRPATARWLSDPERALVLGRLEDEERAKQAEGAHGASLAAAFADPRMWILCVVYFGLAMGIYGVAFWLPQIVKETITTDPVKIGLISAIPWLAAAIVMTWNGRHSDRTGERHWHTGGPALVGALGFAVGMIPGVTGWAGIAALTAATAGVLSAMSSFWSLPTAMLSGTVAAVGIAWINSVGNLAGYVSPFVVGRIRDATHGMVGALGVLAGSLAVAGLLVVAQRRKPSQPRDR